MVPEEYRRAWDDDRTYSGRARIRFFDRQGVELEDTLHLRGKLVHHLVQQNTVGIDSVKSWSHKDAQGFRFDEDRSSLDEVTDLVLAISQR